MLNIHFLDRLEKTLQTKLYLPQSQSFTTNKEIISVKTVEAKVQYQDVSQYKPDNLVVNKVFYFAK